MPPNVSVTGFHTSVVTKPMPNFCRAGQRADKQGEDDTAEQRQYGAGQPSASEMRKTASLRRSFFNTAARDLRIAGR